MKYKEVIHQFQNVLFPRSSGQNGLNGAHILHKRFLNLDYERNSAGNSGWSDFWYVEIHCLSFLIPLIWSFNMLSGSCSLESKSLLQPPIKTQRNIQTIKIWVHTVIFQCFWQLYKQNTCISRIQTLRTCLSWKGFL